MDNKSKQNVDRNSNSSALDLLVSNFLVLAGNYQQAKDYFRARNIRFNSKKVVYNEQSLRGRRDTVLIITGTHYDRMDRHIIGQVAEMLNYKIVFDYY